MASARLSGIFAGQAGSEVAKWAAKLKLTVTGLVVLPAVVLGWLAARAIGSKTMYVMVYAGLLAVVLAWFVSRRRLAVEVERSQLPSRMRVGQMATVELRLKSRRRVSTIVVEESLHPRLGGAVNVPVGSLSAGGELEHSYSFTPALRGVYHVGPTTAKWSDPFGFTTHEQVLAEPVEVLVHPPVEPVTDRVLTRMWEDPPIRPPVSKPWPVGFEFYGMRDYVPGDDLRRVVWTAYAKTGRLLVRESEQGITDRVVVFVDTNRDRHSPGDVSETFETAVKAAASIGVQHLKEGFAVSLLTNEGRVLDGVRGARSELTWLDALARLPLGDTPMAKSAFALFEEARSRPHFVVLTPHLDSAEAQQLKLVVDRGVSVVIAKLVWDESDPMSLARAAGLGCQVVQIPPGASLQGVFSHQIGAGVRR